MGPTSLTIVSASSSSSIHEAKRSIIVEKEASSFIHPSITVLLL
jgi:hypothetical protein